MRIGDTGVHLLQFVIFLASVFWVHCIFPTFSSFIKIFYTLSQALLKYIHTGEVSVRMDIRGSSFFNMFYSDTRSLTRGIRARSSGRK